MSCEEHQGMPKIQSKVDDDAHLMDFFSKAASLGACSPGYFNRKIKVRLSSAIP
jgi:hypothetical protein